MEKGDFLRDLGFRLRQIRIEKGWTLEQVEEHGWNNWRHLQLIETGKKNVTIWTLKKLSQTYDMELVEMIRLVA